MNRQTIVYASAVLVGGMCCLTLVLGSFEEASVRLAIRLTAATSFALLLCTFSARPLLQLTRHPTARSLMRYRRQLGISVGISHSFHLAMIFLLVPIAFDGEMSGLGSLSDNSVAIALYILLYAMVLSSNNTSQRLLGRGWGYLHRSASYALMLAFTAAYLRNAIDLGNTYYWVLASFGATAFLLRFLSWRQASRSKERAVVAPR